MAVTFDFSECCPRCGDAMTENDDGNYYCADCRIGYNSWEGKYIENCDEEEVM